MLADRQLPLVSVIIPCYNYGRFIQETISSVIDSNYANIEIIVVDDGSNDPLTVEVINGYYERSDVVQVIRQQNKGLPGARNTGIKHAKGQYILPLDADDLIDSTYITKAVWNLEKNKDIDIVYPHVQLFGEEESLWITEPYRLNTLLHHNYIPASAIFRKSMWEKIGYYDESMIHGYEDWEFWIRAGIQGYKGLLLREALFYYRKHGQSMLTGSRKRHDEIVKQIRMKHAIAYSLNWRLSIYGYYAFRKSMIAYRKFNNKLIKKMPRVILNTILYLRHTRSIGEVQLTESSQHMNPEITKVKSIAAFSTLYILPWLDIGGVEKVFLNLISNINRQKTGPIFLITTAKHSHPWHKRFIEITDGVYHLPCFCDNENDMAAFVHDFIIANKVKMIHISNSRIGYRLTPMLKKQFPDITIMDTLHMEETSDPWDYFRVSTIYKNYIDQRIVLTSSQKARLVTHYGESEDRVSVISNGVDDLGNCQPGGIRNEISFVGRLVDQKNPEFFLKVVKCLRENGVNDPISIIGQGPLEAKLRRTVKRLHIEENLHFRGAIKNVPQYLLENVRVLIAPSRNEGLPVIGLEAMAAQVLVIASNVPGWNDLIEHDRDGLLMDSSDPATWASQIMQVLSDPNKEYEIISIAQAKVRREYLIKNMVNSYEEHYNWSKHT